jgi:hypothetical protein
MPRKTYAYAPWTMGLDYSLDARRPAYYAKFSRAQRAGGYKHAGWIVA